MTVEQGSVAHEFGLDATQHWFFQRVTGPLMALAPAADEDARRVVSGRLPSSERIAVYQRAYSSRLVECLRDDYPALAYAMGSQFEAACQEFIAKHAPPSPSLNFYGAGFAQFCVTRLGHPDAFWSELARLEWAIVECVHAEVTGSLDPGELGSLSERQWSQARLITNPASRILATTYPVHAYYRAFVEGENPARPELDSCTVVVSRQGAASGVWASKLRLPCCWGVS